MISARHAIAAVSARIHEDEHMTITQAIFEAFTQCRTKSYLSSHSAVAENALGQARQHWDQLYRRNGSSWLRARVLDGQLYVGTSAVEAIQQQQYRVILDCTLQTPDLHAHVHGLELVPVRRSGPPGDTTAIGTRSGPVRSRETSGPLRTARRSGGVYSARICAPGSRRRRENCEVLAGSDPSGPQLLPSSTTSIALTQA
jgi:hypothetical protein